MMLVVVLLAFVSASTNPTAGLVEDHHVEPSEKAYDAAGQKGERPWSVPRVSSITTEMFREYAAAGKPIIVTDATRDWPMAGLDTLSQNITVDITV